MKKTNSKLQLKTNTVRVLAANELSEVRGAGPTADCTQQQSACSHPPEHTPGSHHHA